MTYPTGQNPTEHYRINALETSVKALRASLVLSEAQADRRAYRAFWRGVVFGGILTGAAFIGTAAFALDISGSTVTLEPSADPSAFADVVFFNDLSNGPTDTGAYTISQDGLVIGTRFVWDSNFIGADQITVTPPAGMTCKPADCTATVIEGQTGRVTLFEFIGY